jgi:hypothetical protein
MSRAIDGVWPSYRRFYAAREKAGRPDLRFHDLRHTGATLAAMTGNVTLAELMARLGHATPAAAMRYQHAAAGRDEQIAEALSKIAGALKPRSGVHTPPGEERTALTSPTPPGESAPDL